jgi:hypothetical protein
MRSDGIEDLKRKIAEIDTQRNTYSTQQQKAEDDVSKLTQSMLKNASYILYIRS